MAVSTQWRGVIKGSVCGALAFGLVACHSNSPTAPKVATTNLNVPVTAATVAALIPASGGSGTSFSFGNGFSGVNSAGGNAAVNLSGPTTVAIGGTAAAPTFQITNGGGTASGTLSFGSCHFKVTVSTVPALHVNDVLVVDPCTLTLGTAGLSITGQGSNVSATLLLGGSSSTTSTISGVTVGSDGTVTVNGTTVGTVPTGGATGGNG